MKKEAKIIFTVRTKDRKKHVFYTLNLNYSIYKFQRYFFKVTDYKKDDIFSITGVKM